MRRAAGKPPIRVRIGLHSGPAVVGNIGAPGRVNFTVVGDTVNVAQRFEQLGKEFMRRGRRGRRAGERRHPGGGARTRARSASTCRRPSSTRSRATTSRSRSTGWSEAGAILAAMWIRNAWYVAAWTHEIEPGRIHARTIIDQPLVIYRTSDGEIVALEDRCPHRFAPLSMGRLEGDALRCMYHGLKFAPDGRCIEIPGQKLIPQSACVRRYPLQVVGSWVWVWMGEADKADPAAIPPSLALDDPAYRLQAGQLDYDAALPADRRQPARSLASQLRAREDARPRHAAMGRRAAAHRAARPRPALPALAAQPSAARLHEEARRAGRRLEQLRLPVPGRLPAAHRLLSRRHRRAERRQGAGRRAAVLSHRRAGGDAGRPPRLALLLRRRHACARTSTPASSSGCSA